MERVFGEYKKYEAMGSGGGVYVTMFTPAIFESNVFKGNSARQNGGAIDMTAGAVCRFVGKNVFSQNRAIGDMTQTKTDKAVYVGYGGAVHVTNSRAVFESGSTFTENRVFGGRHKFLKIFIGYGGGLCAHARTWKLNYSWENYIPAITQMNRFSFTKNRCDKNGGGAVACVRHYHKGAPKNVLKIDLVGDAHFLNNVQGHSLPEFKKEKEKTVGGVYFKDIYDAKFNVASLEKTLLKGLKQQLLFVLPLLKGAGFDEKKMAKSYAAFYTTNITSKQMVKDRMVNCKLKGNSGYQYAVLDKSALRNLELKNNKIDGPVYPAAGK